MITPKIKKMRVELCNSLSNDDASNFEFEDEQVKAHKPITQPTSINPLLTNKGNVFKRDYETFRKDHGVELKVLSHEGEEIIDIENSISLESEWLLAWRTHKCLMECKNCDNGNEILAKCTTNLLQKERRKTHRFYGAMSSTEILKIMTKYN